jgi:hypothetical protein
MLLLQSFVRLALALVAVDAAATPASSSGLKKLKLRKLPRTAPSHSPELIDHSLEVAHLARKYGAQVPLAVDSFLRGHGRTAEDGVMYTQDYRADGGHKLPLGSESIMLAYAWLPRDH